MRLEPNKLEEAGVIAIIRSPDPGDLVAAAEALHRGGVRAMEVTLNTPGALETIHQIASNLAGRMHVGAGTILGAADARAAIDAGAQFIVTPTFQPDSITACRERGVPICCGCLSATEMLAADRLGSEFIKVFPATTVGLATIVEVLEELPQLRLVPTGGVTAQNLAGFVRAGCAAVAVGSALVSRKVLQERDWAMLEHQARAFMSALAEARQA
jgi:2-dehydro-3-deoxyphosphogluconate aldolase/(4S)-4-hydroxy-2-oxoglutarate aldolase